MVDQRISEPIDLVYTWVDGAKSSTLQQQNLPSDSQGGENRFRNNNELLQSIHSFSRFCPFVSRIFIVTAEGQVPHWYRPSSYPNVRIVHHPEIFQEHAHLLPVFNSHAIEAMLPRIPGLAEQFVYFNDDTFLGRNVKPDDFFDSGKRAVIRVREKVGPAWQYHRKAWRVYRGNTYRALTAMNPDIAVYDTAHQAKPLLKSVCLKVWENSEMKELLVQTASNRFRSLQDISPIELFSCIMLHEGKGVMRKNSGTCLHLFDRSVLGPEFLALRLMQPKFYCINDEMVEPSSAHLRTLRSFLNSSLPHHLSDSKKPRPLTGAVVKLISHCLSWLHRQTG